MCRHQSRHWATHSLSFRPLVYCRCPVGPPVCHDVMGDVMTRAPARAVLPLLCCGVVAVVVSRASEVCAHLRVYSNTLPRCRCKEMTDRRTRTCNSDCCFAWCSSGIFKPSQRQAKTRDQWLDVWCLESALSLGISQTQQLRCHNDDVHRNLQPLAPTRFKTAGRSRGVVE